ncbi:phenoloxidase-activating factor 2 [Drosophila sechellia]|uniref:GM16570 n=1 Tax=Drosophila sechellia TaxID=7238 RepID=B4IDF8_DROSE|nr:phenoloxidase-activating factor 2 [Drosophila sechellia]EDW45584.1 GM16570 [Drosophila sechellia]
MTLYFAFLATLIISLASGQNFNYNQIRPGTYGSNPSENRIETLPWVVAVLDQRDWLFRYIGVGSLIKPNVVLTAAHILNETIEDDLLVRAGEWDTSTTADQQHVDLEVLNIVSHEQFNRFNAENNMALLILVSAFEMTAKINIIPLYLGEANIRAGSCFFNGWGKVYLNSTDYPTVLKAVQVDLVSIDMCSRRLRRNLPVQQLCGEGLEGKDCSGDGGAPLVCQILTYPSKYAQVGIVNWLSQVPGVNTPTVYTNVRVLLPWIDYQLRLGANFRLRS